MLNVEMMLMKSWLALLFLMWVCMGRLDMIDARRVVGCISF